MDVKFYTTTSSKLSDLPIVNGQLIFLEDTDAGYYDMGNTRRNISGVQILSALPSTAVVQEDIIYGIVNAAGHVDSYVWNDQQHVFHQMTGYAATANTLGLTKPDGTTLTIDGNGVMSVSAVAASQVTYSSSVSGLQADDAQDAIDELSVVATSASSQAAAASTAASTAISIANNASDVASAASTAVAAQAEIIAAQSTAIADLFSRLSAVEDVANIALIVEDDNAE